jgi:phenylpropionate dioxygenase-like ring-hydroxylating dioxygenase large terminal subunit
MPRPSQLEPQLTAPPTKRHVSVARMTNYWYVACESRALATRKPLSVMILGVPLVLFRTEDGTAGALLDRCPHRNIPLSMGKVCGEALQCNYHGWEFDTRGACLRIPGLVGPVGTRGREATAYPGREQQGYVWVFANAEVEPDHEPYTIPFLDDSRYSHARRIVEAEGTLHATIENALDVPHTSFLHKGLFRGKGERHDITAHVRRWSDRVEAQYIGEPRPKGLAARIISPSGGEVTHFDRFYLPSIAEVDYAIGDDTHFSVTSLCTPISDFHTRLFAAISFRLKRVPGWLIKPVLEPMGRKIFSQDAEILKLQTQSIQRFGGEQFVSTDIDVLGPHIWRLMKAAERGDAKATDDPPFEKQIAMNV